MTDELNRKPIKIAIMGQMRAGKDTVAELLKQKAEFKEHKFSDGITEIIKKYFPDVLTEGKPRLHYQHIGQSLRQLDSDIWVKQLNRKLETWKKFNPSVYSRLNFIITDVRQQNEVYYCRDNGFILIKVVADEAVRKQRILAEGDTFSDEQLVHETEQGIDSYDCDFLIDNSGSMKELQEQVDNVWKKITGGTE